MCWRAADTCKAFLVKAYCEATSTDVCAGGKRPGLMIEYVCWQVLHHSGEMNMCGDRRVFAKKSKVCAGRLIGRNDAADPDTTLTNTYLSQQHTLKCRKVSASGYVCE